MKKIAVVIYGPPGSGKGTQANLLAWVKGIVHFDSGRYLRAILHDPREQHKKLIERERALNDAGILNTPSWVLGLFKGATERISKAGLSIVYSGSPRTLYEAFGDFSTKKKGKKIDGLVQLLEKKYGKKNIYFIELKMSAHAAGLRNMGRRTCAVCGTSVLKDATVRSCPICGGELKVRLDDKPELTKTRIREYEERTFPIIVRLKHGKYRVHVINAEQKPFEVFRDILKVVK